MDRNCALRDHAKWMWWKMDLQIDWNWNKPQYIATIIIIACIRIITVIHQQLENLHIVSCGISQHYYSLSRNFARNTFCSFSALIMFAICSKVKFNDLKKHFYLSIKVFHFKVTTLLGSINLIKELCTYNTFECSIAVRVCRSYDLISHDTNNTMAN